MTFLSRTVRSAVVALALVSPFVFGVSSASSAEESRRWVIEYDALGDSYAAGVGVPPYEECGRSLSGYPGQLDQRRLIELDDFVACAGATTATLVSGGQLEALDRYTELVTISIGGNDIGWSPAVQACLGGTDDQCEAAVEASTTAIRTVLPGLLDSVYSQVSQRAPRARVIVTGYPRFFSPEYGDFLGASVAEQQAMNAGADLLNSVIAREAGEHCFRFVDVTDRFVGHGVNSPEPWILGPLDPAAFHPNLAGYQAYAEAALQAIWWRY